MIIGLSCDCFSWFLYLLYFPASLGLNGEQKAIQEMALNFAKNEMSQQMAIWDEQVVILSVAVQIIHVSPINKIIMSQYTTDDPVRAAIILL